MHTLCIFQKDKNIKLTPTARRRVTGSINVYKDNTLVGRVINGGNDENL